jgi:hypothetical protein
VLGFVLEYRANRPFPQFRGIPLRCVHNSILSRNAVSGNPGAIHIVIMVTIIVGIMTMIVIIMGIMMAMKKGARGAPF